MIILSIVHCTRYRKLIDHPERMEYIFWLKSTRRKLASIVVIWFHYGSAICVKHSDTFSSTFHKVKLLIYNWIISLFKFQFFFPRISKTKIVFVRIYFVLFYQPFERNSIQRPAPQCAVHQTFEAFDIFSEQVCSLVIQWIIRIRFVEQVDEPINNRINVQHVPPVFS